MLESLSGTDFVLTGASALIEHGLIHRPTQDVDLFSTQVDAGRVPEAVERIREGLEAQGATVEATSIFPGYSRGVVHWNDVDVDFDIGVDWRGYDAVTLDIGPVLDIRDSVGSKTAALYSRYEARDYMDVAAIVLDGRWSPEEIMSMGANNDPGFDRDRFATVVLSEDHIPSSDDFRVAGIDQASENRMRDALTVLRCAAQGQDVDAPSMLTALEARRVAMPGRTQPLTQQLGEEARSPRPGSRRAAGLEHDPGHER